MSELLQQPVFLKDLHQPFFLKESPSVVGDEPPIDVGHLARMTLGERSVEFQVLELFDRQAEVLLDRMQEVGPAGVASLAHTLAGSARGIGAWQVAEAAEVLERVIAENRELASALQMLEGTVIEARLAICAMLRIQLSPRRKEAEDDSREIKSAGYDAYLIRRPCQGRGGT
jgi:HPt (histidine-containing phosphotransfer) domain-containing protein